ncbi:MAG: TetR/AcrR family transcriptional regulator [Candidatus Omnitrophica bacterium]|nr:TetR/AcrR family transcriptional regulator [Candidatus Omnitrophota bacterium]
MVKVKKENQPARLKIIQTAFDLFHKQGVNATSVDEILEKSQAGKSQFYYYFKNKEDLVHSVLMFFYGQLKNNELPINNKIESWKDLERWFYNFVGMQKAMNCDRGCPIGTIGSELVTGQDLIRQDIKLIFEFTRNSLSRFFHGLKVKGELKDSVDPDVLADFCFTVMQGGLLVAKINRESDIFENSIQQALAYLKSLAK